VAALSITDGRGERVAVEAIRQLHPVRCRQFEPEHAVGHAAGRAPGGRVRQVPPSTRSGCGRSGRSRWGRSPRRRASGTAPRRRRIQPHAAPAPAKRPRSPARPTPVRSGGVVGSGSSVGSPWSSRRPAGRAPARASPAGRVVGAGHRRPPGVGWVGPRIARPWELARRRPASGLTARAEQVSQAADDHPHGDRVDQYRDGAEGDPARPFALRSGERHERDRDPAAEGPGAGPNATQLKTAARRPRFEAQQEGPPGGATRLRRVGGGPVRIAMPARKNIRPAAPTTSAGRGTSTRRWG